jgi:sulfite exporter TauE/SafE
MNGWLEAMIVAAFAAGALGGVHCAAMCGGLVGMACRASGDGAAPRWRYALAYNGGRILSYAVAGAIAGALGQAGLLVRGDALAQKLFLVIASLALVVLALHLAGFASVTRAAEAAGSLVWRQVKPFSGWFLPVNSAPRAFGLGMVWGWLPCGMVYAALLPALATGNAWQGALVMLAFGVGTLPNLLALALAFERLQRWTANRALRYAVSASIAGLGAFGLIKATQPALFAADGFVCRVVPGLAGILH